MAYNLYQVQMSRAWVERIDKENAVAEKFWTDQALKGSPGLTGSLPRMDTGSVAGSKTSSACPSGYTSKTTYLKDRLEKLEADLQLEKEHRRRVETDLLSIKSGLGTRGAACLVNRLVTPRVRYGLRHRHGPSCSMGIGTSAPVTEDRPADLRLELTLNCPVDTEAIIATAEAAGRAILSVYTADTSSWAIESKSDASPLTKADREANSIICTDLMRMSPHIPIVSEENKILPYDIRKAFQYFWLVDPLDGTKEFIQRNGEFTVNIALVGPKGPVLGVVHVPCQNKTYWAVQGQGAWARVAGGKDTRLKAAPFKLDQAGLKIVGSKSHLNEESKEFVELFKSPEFTQVGSSLKLLMVAEGSAHIYPRLWPTCEWDIAAADVIVREAGGVVLQAGKCDNKGKALEDWKEELMKEQAVVYNKPDLLNPFFVVFGQRLPSDPAPTDT